MAVGSEKQRILRKVTALDRKVLFELDRNARAPISSLAKVLGIPEATARYRVENLLAGGVISSAYPVLGVGQVGMSVHKFMFKLQKADERETTRFVEYLVAHPLVNWVARLDGAYDAGCTLLVKDISQVSEFLDGTRKKFHHRIRQMSYAVNIQAEFYPRDYLVRERRAPSSKAAIYTSHSEGEVTLDALDWHILRSVTDNVRESATAIGAKLQYSSETIGRRLRVLEKKQVVTGYRLDVEPSALGRTSYYLLLYLNFVSDERLRKMLQYLRNHAAVVYLIKMLGEWDYDVSLELKNSAEYREFMVELMQHFSDVIRDVQVLTSWKVAKFSILPKTVLLRE